MFNFAFCCCMSFVLFSKNSEWNTNEREGSGDVSLHQQARISKSRIEATVPRRENQRNGRNHKDYLGFESISLQSYPTNAF